MIDVVGVSRWFGPSRRALSDVSFGVAGGSVTGLLGPNGAGKTTLFRILAGLLRPDSGRAVVCGHDLLVEPARARALVGLLTEEPGLPGRLTPLWHVALHASLRGIDRRAALRRSRSLLEQLGAGDAIDQPHARLSKGTRAKVALARALVHEPVALLLDEPTANLDIETSAVIRASVRARAGDGCAALVATHDPAAAEDLCDQFVILGMGRLLAAGSLAALRREAGCVPRLEARLSGPAGHAIERVRELAWASQAETRGEWLILPGRLTGILAGLAAAVAPMEILELRRQEAPLVEVYRRLQEGAA